MTAPDRVSAALRDYEAGIDAANAALEATMAQAFRAIREARRARDAAAMLADARCLKALDAGCAHDRIEDAPDGIIGCCAPAGAS
jgi:hypothetical protein